MLRVASMLIPSLKEDLKVGYRALRATPGPLMFGSFLLVVAAAIGRLPDALPDRASDEGQLGVAMVSGLIALLLEAGLRPGFIQVLHRALRSEHAGVQGLFLGVERLLPMFGTLFLSYMAVILAIGIAMLPGLVFALVVPKDSGLEFVVALLFIPALPAAVFVWLTLCLAPWEVALQRSGPIKAIKGSWKLTRGVRLELLLLYCVWFVATLLAFLVGLLMLVVGVFITVSAVNAIRDAAVTHIYWRQLSLTQSSEPTTL